MVEHPRAFVTLTAPSFGPVHTRAVTPRGIVRRCGCGERHHVDDPRIGGALDPDAYDYEAAVLWNAHAGMLWARFATHLRRARPPPSGSGPRLPQPRAGSRSPRSPSTNAADWSTSTPSSASTDPTDPPTRHRPGHHQALRDAVHAAARHRCYASPDPTATPLTLSLGSTARRPPVTATAAAARGRDTGEMTDEALAAYIAKYATKGAGPRGARPPVGRRRRRHLVCRPPPPHDPHRLDSAPATSYAGLNLRRWAHMLGFRGHFPTKSRRYSTTLAALRTERRETTYAPRSANSTPTATTPTRST